MKDIEQEDVEQILGYRCEEKAIPYYAGLHKHKIREFTEKKGDTTEIYLLRCGNSNFYKIGIAEDVSLRLKTIQNYSPYHIHLLATISGGSKLEAALHRRFSKQRHRGEWFRFSEEEVKEIIKAFSSFS